MSGAQLDEYLDWFEKTWADEEGSKSKKSGIPEQLLDTFPTGRLDGSPFAEISFEEESKIDQVSVDQNLANVQESLKMREVVSKEQEGKTNTPVRRIGNFYKRYRKTEDLTPQARNFYEKVASLVGISLSSLLLAVLQTERKLQIWRGQQLEKEGDSENEESVDNIDDVGEDGESQTDSDGLDREDEDDMMDDVVVGREMSDG